MLRRICFFLFIGALLILVWAAPLAAQSDVYYPTNGWRTSTPEAQGVNSAQLVEFLNQMTTLPDSFHSILVIRHGSIVLDVSSDPFSSSKPQAFRDSSEPVLDSLIGIAIDKGYIKGVNQSIWDFLPKDQIANMDENKTALTIDDFLTHRSGLNIGPGWDFQQYYPLMGKSPSWLQVFLSAKTSVKPGTTFAWYYGDGLVLSAVLQKATGMTALDFAKQNLFSPLGITDVTWLPDPQGITIGYDEFYASPQDMAKIAYLYLHNGRWDGQQIVSEEWVKRSTSSIQSNNVSGNTMYEFDGMGYGWNVTGTGQTQYFEAVDAGGEQYGVFPELDMIFMVTGDIYNSLTSRTGTGKPEAALFHSLIPSISASAALPENADGLAALNAKIATLTNPAARNVATLPKAFEAVSGKMYTLDANPTGWQTLSLNLGTPGSKEATVTLGINGKTIQLAAGLDFVNRVTPVGLPAQPDSGAYRLLGGIPWNARISWMGKLLNIWMGDQMGRENWQLTLTFPADNRVSVKATMYGLETYTPDQWYFGGTAQ